MEKEVFERMLSEFNELNERVTNCREFLLDEEKSKVLDALNRDLLVAQLGNYGSTFVNSFSSYWFKCTKRRISSTDTEETVVPEAVND